MTATPSPQDQEIVEVLKRLGTHKVEYPSDLLAARRAAFIAQIDERKEVGEKEDLASETQIAEGLGSLKNIEVEYPPELLAARRAAFLARVKQQKEVGVKEELASETQVIDALGSLKNIEVEYPPELFAAKRAAFLAQVRQQKEIGVKEELPSTAQVIGVLESLKAAPVEYPSDLLAARRVSFLAQIEQHNRVEVVEELPVQNKKLIGLFDRLKSIEIEYPLKLWTARRAAFLKRISRESVSILDALRSALQNILDQLKSPQAPMMKLMRSSLIVAGILVAAFVGTLLYGNQSNQLFSPLPAQTNASQPVVATDTVEAAEVICKPGYLPPLCLAQEFNKSEDLTFQGNGSARPAVAKDTIPGYHDIHRAAYINDGLYGAGASWISNSAYSWIKIDLGKPTTINTITFGRDRLGNYNDRDPGQFVIAVALHDNVYADGNSSDDFFEYTKVYDSKKSGFDGVVSGSETIQANFVPTEARFVKITFENPGTAIDEVEAFMVQPPSLVYVPTKSRENQPRPTWTPVPTNTLVPTDTPTLVPTDTPLPTSTPTPYPTSTPTDVPTSTPTDIPTNTPRPTNTPTDLPTNTPRPTNTPTDVPTSTPRPTYTPTPYPTDTPFPTSTSVPPTSTPFQPTNTAEPTLAPTDTPFAPTVP